MSSGMLLAAFASGARPWARSTRVERVVLREVAYDRSSTRLACGDGWTLHARVWHEDLASLHPAV